MPLAANLRYYAAEPLLGNKTDLRMKKLLIITTCIASLSITACSGVHLVHKIDVQQGNVITQDQVNQLEPGMSRRQVQFIMGSPMIADAFHQDRWDYIYRMKPGYGEVVEERISLFFKDDVLSSTSGTVHPQPDSTDSSQPKQVTLVVPPEERVEPGIFNKLWHWMTFRKAGEDSYVASKDK
jgi:outer membrane protein assembly factor BamE